LSAHVCGASARGLLPFVSPLPCVQTISSWLTADMLACLCSKSLVESGNTVTAVSKSGAAPAWAAGEAWASEVTWVSNDFTRGSRQALEAAIGEPDALVSCVGAVGFDRQALILANGKANADIASAAAKLPNLQSVVYVSVSNEVDESVGWLTGRSLRSNSWRWGMFAWPLTACPSSTMMERFDC
jgi:hypothetical protein